MAVWHVDCQYIPTESLIESDCTAYVAYKKVAGTATMFTGFNTVDCQPMTSVKRPSLRRQQNEPGIVWLPFSIADAVKRRTFNINNFNRRTMVQGAGLVMPDWLKSRTEERSREAGRCVGIVRIAEKSPGSTAHMILKAVVITTVKDGENDN